ncbi:AAA family ATPase [Listeria sp. PSOL-1]|uniref:ATP-binding protein n=1 Tax=Listeria sp. PSOL-1 TaxID=1844999 RepID=UPI0013D81DF1|nr:AAA family ATPase [Listeria sp. PSOL-1]
MKITKIEIIGYGKWQNQVFEEIADFQMFYGENEAGKSTITAFVHSILFGFPTKQQRILRMEPKNKGPYGGRLTLADTALGNIVIERLRGKVTGDVTITLEDGTTFGEEKLSEFTFGMDRVTYEAIFSFDIHGLQHIQQMKQEEFEKYLLASGGAGSNRLFSTVDKLQKQLETLFKPNGRNPLINQQLEKTKNAQKKYFSSKKQNMAYESLRSESVAYEQKETALLTRQKEQQLAKNEIDILLKKWPLYEEWQGLSKIINQANDSQFQADGLLRLEQLNHFEMTKKNQRSQVEERLNMSRNLAEANVLTENDEKEVAQLLAEWPIYQEKVRQNKEDEDGRLINEQEITRLMQEFAFTEPEEKIDWQANFNKKAADIEHAKQELVQKQLLLTYQQQEKKKSLDKVQSQVDQLERDMWSTEELKNAKKRFETKGKERYALFIGVFCFVVFILLGFLFKQVFFYGIALLCIGFSYLKRMNHPNDTDAFAFFEQKRLRNSWQQLLSEMDVIAEESARLETEFNETSSGLSILKQEEFTFLSSLGMKTHSGNLREVIAAWQIFLKECSARELHEERLKQNQIFLDTWERHCYDLVSKELSTEAAVLKLQTLYQTHHEKTKQLATSKEQIEQAKNQLDLLEKDLADIETKKEKLLQSVGAATESEFQQIGFKAQEFFQAKERGHLLEAQLPKEIRERLASFQNQEALKEAELEHEACIQEIEQELSRTRTKRVELKHQIAILEEGGLFSETVQDYFTAKSELNEQVEDWVVTKIAESLIQRAMGYLQDEKLPRALQFATEYFKQLTKGQYQFVRFEKGSLEVLRHDHVIFKPDELSQATKEQLYLAIRFALIETLAKKYPFPLLIDDGFVNFDEQRFEAIMELLKSRKLKNQVLFFTCHQEANKYFSREETLMLY